MTRIDVTGLGEYIRDQRNQAEMSLRQLAESAGVSNPYLSQIERGLRKPSAEILSQIAKGLRISAETLYVRAGILEEERQGNSVVTALALDGSINDRQRQVLMEIYTAFCSENAVHASEQSFGQSQVGSTVGDRGTTYIAGNSAPPGRASELPTTEERTHHGRSTATAPS